MAGVGSAAFVGADGGLVGAGGGLVGGSDYFDVVRLNGRDQLAVDKTGENMLLVERQGGPVTLTVKQRPHKP